MQGWTGKSYGSPSRWHPTLAAQAVELECNTQPEWLAILRDLKDAWHMPLRRWVPVPVDFSGQSAPHGAIPQQHESPISSQQLPRVSEQSASGSENVLGLPREIHSGVEGGASPVSATAEKTERAAVCAGISTARETEKRTLPGLREYGIADASPELRQTTGGNLAVPPLSSQGARDDLEGLKHFTLCKIARDEGLDPGNRPAGVPVKDFIRAHRKQQTAGV